MLPQFPFDSIRAEGNGYIAFSGGDHGFGACAESAQGSSLLGWYDENGELIYTGPFMLFADAAGCTRVIARFDGGAIMSDIDGNGSVMADDALTALRAAMGVLTLTPEQIVVGDMNGNGTVDVSDALTILRLAMGLA